MTPNEPAADPVAEFRVAIKGLYVAIGAPAYRTLTASTAQRRLSHSTISDLLSGDGTPRWNTVERFVRACAAYSRRIGKAVQAELLSTEYWKEKHDNMLAAAESVPQPALVRQLIGTIPPPADCFQQRPLDPDAVLAPGGTAVLSGLGGVGKTQAAAQLARAALADGRVELLVWINAVTRENLVVGYGQAANELTGVDAAVLEHAAGRFLTWLANTDQRWLVVLDDLTDPSDLTEMWPPTSEASDGRVLITTRSRDSAVRNAGRRFIDISTFEPGEATEYLSAKLAHRRDSVSCLSALAGDLGHLPLALAQAAAYLEDRDLTCEDYRTRFADRRRLTDLLPEQRALPDGQHAIVAATWSLSVDRADTLNPVGLARPLLELASYLDPNGIPERIFTTAAAASYLQATRTAASAGSVPPDDARDALRCLHRVSLATVSTTDGHVVVEVHALVQRATRDALPPERAASAARAAADAVLQAWPPVENGAHAARALRASVDALTRYAADLLSTDGVHPVLLRAAQSTGDMGDIAGALAKLATLQDVALRQLGSGHSSLLKLRHEHAYWTGQGGDYGSAVRETESLLADSQRILGAEHPDTLRAQLYLARWRGLAGQFGRAAATLEDLTAQLTEVLGADHEDTLTARNDHAYFTGRAGDFAGAAALFAGLLDDRLRVLGPEHPHTLTNRNDLHVSQGEAGDLGSAVAGLEGLVPDLARVLGPDHPKTLAARGNLARWRGKAGDPATAVHELTVLVMDFQRAIGPDHPYTLRSHGYLADLQRSDGT